MTDGKTEISSYLAIWRPSSDIDDFLSDIDLCLNGHYDEIEDPEYSDWTLQLYGTLTANTLVISDKERINSTIIPLSDFKELLLSWKEFLMG